MTIRSRTRDLRSAFTGSYYNYLANPATVYSTSAMGTRDWIEDVVGHPTDDNPLAIKQWIQYQPRLNGQYRSSFSPYKLLKEFIDRPIDYRPDPPDSRAPFSSLLSEVARIVLAQELLAKTTPMAPHVSVPTVLGELKDLPSLVHGWGRNVIQLVAKGHITWRWGLKPMISDVCKLLDFAKAVDVRWRWLNTLQKGKSIRRRVSLRSGTAAASAIVYLQSSGCIIRATRSTTYTEKVWGTARWKAVWPTYIPHDLDSQYKLARRLTLGITGYEALAAAWELMPWSWLIDWFADVGGYIQSHNNTVPLDCDSICLMQKTSSRATYSILSSDSPWVTLVGPHMDSETRKMRYPVSPLLCQILPPIPSMPYLGVRQWSILGSLAALRAIPVPRTKGKRTKIRVSRF